MIMAYSLKICGVYIITSLIDSKYYIGRSHHCIERFCKHKSMLRKNKHCNQHLQSAWNKYGENNFTFDVLDESEIEILPSLEHWWCNMLNVHDRKFGYNVDPTSPFGKIRNSAETREKIRIKNTGFKTSEETKQKLRIYNLGKKKSHETVDKLRNNKKNIRIDMYDKYGNFIQTYKSIREAERETNIQSIRMCLLGKHNLLKGMIFKHHGDILSDDEIKYRNENSLDATKVPVIGYYLDGTIVGEFDSFYQASKATGLDSYKISLCCRKIQKRVKNTIWHYGSK